MFDNLPAEPPERATIVAQRHGRRDFAIFDFLVKGGLFETKIFETFAFTNDLVGLSFCSPFVSSYLSFAASERT